MNLKWAEFKSIIDSKSLAFQESDHQDQYCLTTSEASQIYNCNILKTTPKNSDQTDYEDNYQANKNADIILKTQNKPSTYDVSLRIEGESWLCPADTETTFHFPLNDDYEIRGAEFQFVNGKYGDFVEVWITDKDGAVYPAGS